MDEIYNTEQCLICGATIGGTALRPDYDENGSRRLRFEPFRLPHGEGTCARQVLLNREEWPHQAT